MRSRSSIIRNCPEEFKEELEDYLNGIEIEFSNIRDLLTIKDVNDLCNVEEAYEIARDMSKILY
jgi:hypothetical protein